MHKHVLLVEDDAAIAAFVTTALEREGCAVTQTRTGEDALRHVRRHPPDLILLDLMLPGDDDGLQVCRRVRRGEYYIPIIMLTPLLQKVYISVPFCPSLGSRMRLS